MIKEWLKKTFSDDDSSTKMKVPEVMGLRLGGAFELDALKLKLIEPELIIEGAAKTHLIQTVGHVQLDDDSALLRFYTDDEGYLQVNLSGGMDESHIADVKLWYYYETKGIATKADWDNVLETMISLPEFECEGHTFTRVWDSMSETSPPLAMTELTYNELTISAQVASQTDQFAMLYERELSNGAMEYLLVCGEEKIIDNRADRCLVISTGFDIDSADIHIIG